MFHDFDEHEGIAELLEQGEVAVNAVCEYGGNIILFWFRVMIVLVIVSMPHFLGG